MPYLQFPKEFFEGEEREGFFVEETMKHAWAAQLEVLKEVEAVCRRHGIQFFADYGTLLGAVRHKGFVPWDDDIDITMLRADYERFIHEAVHDLPEGYLYLNIHNQPDFSDYLTRVVNHPMIDTSEEIMTRYHGCPFVVGIDIEVLDYIPRNEDEFQLYCQMMEITAHTAELFANEDEDVSWEEKFSLLKRVEDMTQVTVDANRPIAQQLRILTDRIGAMFTEEDADYLGTAIRQFSRKQYWVKKEAFASFTELPFEVTTVPVPIGYEAFAETRFGENYMTPIQAHSHDYPFYKDQQRILEETLREKGR